MYVKDFVDGLVELAEEISCDGNGNIGSHSIPSYVIFSDEEDNDYELDNIQLNGLSGCGCPVGIVINLKKIREDK